MSSPREIINSSSSPSTSAKRKSFTKRSNTTSNSLGARKRYRLESMPMGGSDIPRRMSSFNQEELTRIVLQSLQDMGFHHSVSELEKESGYLLESPDIAEFRSSVLTGNWDRVNTLLPILCLSAKETRTVQILICEQKYLELIEKQDRKNALAVLRNDLSPLHAHPSVLHRLSLLLMCSPQLLYKNTQWQGSTAVARTALLEKIQLHVSKRLMIPERRLDILLSQAMKYQQSQCLYHNSLEAEMSLYTDHLCDKEQIPRHVKYELKAHTDEVWYLAFSNDGTMLATASKDMSAIIWRVRDGKRLHVLKGHSEAVSFLLFSPDDTMLLTCSADRSVKLWLTSRGTHRRTFTRHVEQVTSCVWMADNEKFMTAGHDKQLLLWNIDGSLLCRWQGPRISDMTMSRDFLYTIAHDKKIRRYQLPLDGDKDLEEQENFVLQELQSMTSITVNDYGQMLVNCSNQELHLWDVKAKNISQIFKGHKQAKYVIRSCFGGESSSFVLSGSEDGQVCIWHKDKAALLAKLPHHNASVNCVAWSPSSSHLFASASDDHSVALWDSRKNGEKGDKLYQDADLEKSNNSNGKHNSDNHKEDSEEEDGVGVSEDTSDIIFHNDDITSDEESKSDDDLNTDAEVGWGGLRIFRHN